MNNSMTQPKSKLTSGNEEEVSTATRPRPVRIKWESITIDMECAGDHTVIGSADNYDSSSEKDPTESASLGSIDKQEVLTKATKAFDQNIFDPVQPEAAAGVPGEKKPVARVAQSSSKVDHNHAYNSAIPDFIKDINKNYFVAYEGCQARVFRETTDPLSGKWMLDSLSLSSLRKF